MTMNAVDGAREDWDEWRTNVGRNYFDSDLHFAALLAKYGREDTPFRVFGETVAALDGPIRENNRDENLPVLRRWGPQGERLETVAFHPSYHQIGRAVYGSGLMGLYAEPGREFETLGHMYLFSQNGEAGHACPLACTAGLIKILQASGGDHSAWLERLYDPNYDTHFHGAQFLTEAQGGSDVGSNAVVATEGEDGWRLHGEKWFCSVIDAQMFVVTARPEGASEGTRGLQAFAVPRQHNGVVNDFAIRRLKYKLGTRSMASAEVDFQGSWGVPVGDFRTVVQVVLNTSRLYNSACSAGMMRRAFREANAYASARRAFGQPIARFPSVARIVARLRTEAWASRGLTFHLAHMADENALGRSTEADQAAWRMLVNLNKLWTSYVGTSCVRDAIEVLGGNGAIEEFSVLPRLLRDSIVCEAWEGGHNVLCAQVLRDAKRFGFHEPMFALLDELGGGPELQAAKQRFLAVLDLPDPLAALHIRDAVELLRGPAQAAALRNIDDDLDGVRDVVIEHLLAIANPSHDPMTDSGFSERVQRLVR
jgi:acyl-CoA dehydrogenase